MAPTQARALVLLALALAGGTATAQRRALVGCVVGADGAPLATAAVTLVFTDPGDTAALPDIVTCTTDPRGRFIAKVLPGIPYSAWAVHGVPGRMDRSAICDAAIAGGDCRLVVDRAIAGCEIDVRGLEAWAAFGPFEVAVAPGAANIAFFPVTATGRLPPIAHVLVRDATQRVLLHEEIHGGAIGGRIVVDVPPPRTTRLVVRHFAGGPAVGASVLAATARVGIEAVATSAPFGRPRAMFWREVGTTSADGTVTVTAPQGTGAWPLLVRTADSAECMIVRATAAEVARIDGTMVTTPDAMFRVQLRPATLLGFVHGEQPIHGGDVLVTARYGGFTLCDRTFAGRLGPYGTYEFPLGDGMPIGALVALREGQDQPWHVHRVFPEPGDYRRIDLAADRELQLHVQLPNGDPARGFAGILKPLDDALGDPMHVATDQAGRLALRLGPGAWTVFLTDGTHYAMAMLAADAATDALRPTLVATPFETREFVVQDVQGRPIADAAVAELRLERPRGVGGAGDPTGRFGILRELLPRLHADRRTGADGRIVLPVVGTLVDGRQIVFEHAATGRSGRAAIRPAEPTPVVLPNLGQ